MTFSWRFPDGGTIAGLSNRPGAIIEIDNSPSRDLYNILAYSLKSREKIEIVYMAELKWAKILSLLLYLWDKMRTT